MLKRNKKGFIADTMIGTAALFVVVLVIAVVSMILFYFNEQIQTSEVVTDGGKEASAEAEALFPPILGYGFLALFIGFFLYTIITAILINTIHPIFWILGFVVVLISTVISSIIKLIYGAFTSVEVIAPFVAAIPGANWYFLGLEIIHIVWMGIQLTIIYFRRDA